MSGAGWGGAKTNSWRQQCSKCTYILYAVEMCQEIAITQWGKGLLTSKNLKKKKKGKKTLTPVTHTHTHLSWCLNINEFMEDLVSFRHKLGWTLYFFVLLAGHPKLNILVAELGLEKWPEGSQAIWKGQKKKEKEKIRMLREDAKNNKTLYKHDV